MCVSCLGPYYPEMPLKMSEISLVQLKYGVLLVLTIKMPSTFEQIHAELLRMHVIPTVVVHGCLNCSEISIDMLVPSAVPLCSMCQ